MLIQVFQINFWDKILISQDTPYKYTINIYIFLLYIAHGAKTDF